MQRNAMAGQEAAAQAAAGGTSANGGQPAVFVGRQPILDAEQRIFGYELLFRAGRENAYTAVDGDQATCTTVSNTLNVTGMGQLVAGRKAFINVTRALLLDQMYEVLPPEDTVIELLESVEPDEEVLEACRALKKMKYTLALDDFVFEPKYAPLVQMADIIKVDLTLTPVEQTLELIERCGERIRFLAEKVETQAEFEAAAGAGYTLFQGYFFAKPEIVEARDIPACQQNYLLLLREVSQSKLNIESVERIMRSEPSLSMKLLRYINSAAFGIRNKVESIRQAVLLLGDRMFRKWSSLVAVTCLSEGAGPDELMRNCLTRAEFCDRISAELHMEKRAFDLFLFGLLSGLEAIMRTPLERIIADLPLSEDIRAALLGQGEGQIRDVFELCIALERVDVTSSELLMQRLSLSEDTARQAYEAAVRFADEAMGV